MLCKFILADRPELVVELGVFGGSSFVPQLMALRVNGTGHGHGIDPWSVDAALEEMKLDANKDWWGSLDLQAVYNRLVDHLNANGLASYASLHQAKAEDMVDSFGDQSIGLLHIDGNHGEEHSYADATLWFPKVKDNGLICFDDIWWTEGGTDPTTRRALLFLLERCTRVDLVGDCMLLRKNPTA